MGAAGRGVQLEIGVVCRYHPVNPAAVKLAEYRLGYRPARCRLRSGAEFVYKNEGPFVCLFQHRAHVGEEGTVGAEVVLEGLVVANADHNAVKYR